ncbi:Sperm-associated antigen 16 protein, partial [Cladochytrium tenue]
MMMAANGASGATGRAPAAGAQPRVPQVLLVPDDSAEPRATYYLEAVSGGSDVRSDADDDLGDADDLLFDDDEFADGTDSDEDDDDETLERAVRSVHERSLLARAADGDPSAAAAQSPSPRLKGETRGRAQVAAALDRRPEVVDDFIRNYLTSKGLFKSLEAFQNEWYEFQQRSLLTPEDVSIVPDVYQKNQELSDSLKRLRVDVENYREIASKARATYDKLRKERDFHRMHHKRVVQEKARLAGDLRRLRQHCESYEPTLRQLRHRYEVAMKEKMLTRLERDRLAGKVQGLEASLRAAGARAAAAAGSPTPGGGH